MNMYVVTSTDRTGTADTLTAIFGVYSSREKATDAILYWIFEGEEKAENFSHKDDFSYEFITDKSIWKIEKIEVDFVI